MFRWVTLISKNNTGFTLVEVLIASVILFSSIAIVSVIYKGVLISSQKAQHHIQMDGATPFIISKIHQDLLESSSTLQFGQSFSGEGAFWGVAYTWKAIANNIKAPPVNFDPDSGNMIEHKDKYILWDVDVHLAFKNMEQDIKYNELSWLNEKR